MGMLTSNLSVGKTYLRDIHPIPKTFLNLGSKTSRPRLLLFWLIFACQVKSHRGAFGRGEESDIVRPLLEKNKVGAKYTNRERTGRW